MSRSLCQLNIEWKLSEEARIFVSEMPSTMEVSVTVAASRDGQSLSVCVPPATTTSEPSNC